MDNDAKVRPLYLGKILYERTDEDNWLTTNQLIAILKEEYDINAHRQTIVTEMELLKAFGMNIKCIKSRQNRYQLISREFDLAELKLIIDAVDASKFISAKESKKLSGKLAALAGRNKATELKRHGSAEGRVRTTNEKTCMIIDAINEAINKRKKISFSYFTYDANKKKVLRHNGEHYVFSPYELIWDGDRYYMIGWSDKHNDLRTFRVDRIWNAPEVLKEKAVKRPPEFSVAGFADRNFRMFRGEVKKVTFLCANDTMDSMIDRFGEKVRTERVDEEHFRLTVEVAESHVLYAWVFGFEGKVKIEGPDEMKKVYRRMAKAAVE